MIRKVVFYSGRVQGVGFRFRTAELARRFTIAGYVQNLDDGRVRLEVQGDADQVQGLMDAIKQAMASNIQSQEGVELSADPDLGDGFTIRR